MRALSYYTQLYRDVTPVLEVQKESVETIFKGKPILEDAVEITLAEYDVDTKDAITAHHLKDYRRRVFNLKLLPKIDLLFDHILEGSDYWNELLHTQGGLG